MVGEDSQVTLLLLEWQSGNKAALDRLVPIVYGELRKLALLVVVDNHSMDRGILLAARSCLCVAP
jgi:hypothetical protein